MSTDITPKQRFLFIDIYRSIIIFLMLQGHLFRAVLDKDLQQTSSFIIHELFHGITAPAFLFGAGLTFMISTHPRWEDYHHWKKPLKRRIARILLIFLIGLTLHLPYLSIRKIIIEGTEQDYLQLFACDVLNCIAIGLLLLHALLFFFKTEERFYGLVFGLGLVICLQTPLMWDVDFLQYFPAFFAQLFNNRYGSPFPLFPFVGFLFAGVVVSWEFLTAVEKGEEKQFMRKMFFVGVFLITFGFILDKVPVKIYPTYNFWYTSPNYFLIRVGALLIFVSAIWYFCKIISTRQKIVTVLGRESLFIYVIHLPIIYGSVINPQTSIARLIGPTLNVFETSVFFVFFLALMILLAFVWNYLKEHKLHILRLGQVLAAVIFLTVLFINEH